MNDIYLAHHGIKGMRWGVRRYQNPDGSLTELGYKRYARDTLNKSRMYNMDKFGKDKNHNICYIMGYSGAGKSTAAIGLSNKNDIVIHLDTLLEKDDHGKINTNVNFLNYLKNNGVKVNRLTDTSIDSKDRWKEIDKLGDLLEPYGEMNYKKGKRVIVEGVQLIDDTLFPNKAYFADKCVVVLKPKYLQNTIRSTIRDSKVSDIPKNLFDRERIGWYKIANQTVDLINKNMSTVRNGRRILNDLLGPDPDYYDD